jgi:hypothetical protein
MPLLQSDFLEKVEIAKLKQDNLPPRMAKMYRLYGNRDDKTCGECSHLHTKSYSGTYFKCDLNLNTNGPGSDWRKKWPACGKFEEKKKKM